MRSVFWGNEGVGCVSFFSLARFADLVTAQDFTNIISHWLCSKRYESKGFQFRNCSRSFQSFAMSRTQHNIATKQNMVLPQINFKSFSPTLLNITLHKKCYLKRGLKQRKCSQEIKLKNDLKSILNRSKKVCKIKQNIWKFNEILP